MNYNKIYSDLIFSARCRTLDGYVEKHHVLPKSMGGDNSDTNIVNLTAREHFIAHWLLWKIHKSPKMAMAFFAMARKGPGQNRNISSRQYEIAKKAMSLSKKGENNYWYGTNGPQWGKSKEVDIGIQNQAKILSQMKGDNRTKKQLEWDMRKSSWAKENNIHPPTLKQGSKMMNNGTKSEYVPPYQIQDRLQMGWEFGRLNYHNHYSGLKRMRRDDQIIYVLPEEIESKQEDGWTLGNGPNKKQRIIHKVTCIQCRKTGRIKEMLQHIDQCLPKIKIKKQKPTTKYETCPHCLKTGPRSRMIRFHYDKCILLKSQVSVETSAEKSLRMAKKVTCPHCLSVGSYTIMKRWHFDNCKKEGK